MVDRERVRIEEDVWQALHLITTAYLGAHLMSPDGLLIPQAQMCFCYLKLYQQTPHEKSGQVKRADRSRFVEISPMSPGEYEAYEEPMLTLQENAARQIYVYDDCWQSRSIGLQDYLSYFYNTLYPEGWAIGISPMGLFQTDDYSGLIARCLQLDLESRPEDWKLVMKEMEMRNKADPRYLIYTRGFLASSSQERSHFYSNTYVPYTPDGKVIIAAQFGSALLLNKEGGPERLDDRSVGHQLRSLREDWTHFLENTETGCLRVTRSLLKPDQPKFISYT